MRKFKTIIKMTVIAIAMIFSTSVKTKAIEIVNSSHTYTSYAYNMEIGDEIILNASDIIKYLNAHETGFINTIENNAWFYKTGGSGGLGNAITTTAKPIGSDVNVYEINDTNGKVNSIRIKGRAVGCSILKGKFEWLDKLVTPTKQHKYPFSFGCYVHVKPTGIKLNSTVVSDANTMNYYVYENATETLTTNVLPFNAAYTTWDKVSNNAIQNINVLNSNNKIVSTNLADATWGTPKIELKALKEGASTITVNSARNANYKRTLNVKILKKPIYSVSSKEINLANNVSMKSVKAEIKNLSSNNKCNIKWTSSNTKLLEVSNETSSNPTLKTKGEGSTTLNCTFTDVVAANNKTVNPTILSVKVNIKSDKDLKTQIVTSNNTYIENNDTISSVKEGDVVFVRAEEEGQEAVYSYKSSNEKVCKVQKTNRRGYSFEIVKTGAGASEITVVTKSGKRVVFKYVGEKTLSGVVDPYNNIKPKKPKFSVKYKKKKLYITIKKKASAYNAKGFEIKIKRGNKTVIKTKWSKRTLKVKNVKKGSKYVIYIRTYNATKHSAWRKVSKKIKK